MSETLEILDCEGRTMNVGAPIDGGNGVEGKVVEVREPDEGEGPRVAVEWPEWPGDPEVFGTRPRNYRQEGPSNVIVWVCDDVAVIS